MLEGREEMVMDRPIDAEQMSEIALMSLFLGRLARLVVKETVAKTPEERRLVEWAISSTRGDCHDLGLATEAQRILSVRRPRHEGTLDRL
jgi:hypothetical protein